MSRVLQVLVLLLLIWTSVMLFIVAGEVKSLNERLTASETARIKAEASLAHCMNGGWFNSTVGVLNCGRAL